MRDIPAWLRSATPGQTLIYAVSDRPLGEARATDPDLDIELRGWMEAAEAGLVELFTKRVLGPWVAYAARRTNELSE